MVMRSLFVGFLGLILAPSFAVGASGKVCVASLGLDKRIDIPEKGRFNSTYVCDGEKTHSPLYVSSGYPSQEELAQSIHTVEAATGTTLQTCTSMPFPSREMVCIFRN